MEYILVIVAFCTAVLTADFSISPSARFKNIWSMRPLKKLLFWGLLFVAICQMWVVYQGHCEAEKEKTNLNAHNAELIERNDELKYEVVEANKRLEDTKKQLENANRKLDDNHKLINEQQKLITAQQKSVDSLVFNMPTSLEGKLRFKENFEVLSSLSVWDSSHLLYCCQLCDSGVGVFWFESDTEALKGFCFFSNSEINKILSETPISGDFIDENGEVIANKSGQLAAIYKRFFKEEMSQNYGVAPAQRKASLEIDSHIKELLAYVCRGYDVNIQSYHWDKTRTYSGDKRVSFKYYVNPTVQDPITRFVCFDFSSSFMKSLYGMKRGEFSERVIDELKRLKVRAMVTPSMINYFSKEWLVSKGVDATHYIRNVEATDDSPQILGMLNENITQGLNRVKIECRAVKKIPFPTLRDVLCFTPEENIVGDRIQFDLDGITQSYVVEKWDEIATNYVLMTSRAWGPEFATFASIPCLDKISIFHATPKPLSINKHGAVAGELLKIQKEAAPNKYDGTSVPKKITIK